MIIKVLGKGCKNCALLEQHAKEAATLLSLDFTFEKVTDINEIADYGVMKTPGLVIDEKLVSQGKILSTKAIQSLLESL